MNIDDRTDMLGGMKAGAPPEVFAGLWGLVGSVLTPADYAGARRPPRLCDDMKAGRAPYGALPVSQGRTASPPERTVDGQAFSWAGRMFTSPSAAAPTPARAQGTTVPAPGQRDPATGPSPTAA